MVIAWWDFSPKKHYVDYLQLRKAKSKHHVESRRGLLKKEKWKSVWFLLFDQVSNRTILFNCKHIFWSHLFSCYVSFISIIISGDILQEAVRQLEPGVKVGKILIQRDESTVEKTPKLFYKKLPKDIPDCFTILVDPMLATAGRLRSQLLCSF